MFSTLPTKLMLGSDIDSNLILSGPSPIMVKLYSGSLLKTLIKKGKFLTSDSLPTYKEFISDNFLMVVTLKYS